MASDGRLVFPVKFDLDSAVKQASGDADKVLRELQTRINAKPLTITPKVDDAALRDMSNKLSNLSIPSAMVGNGKNRYIAATGSINALSAAMQKCINEWNRLSEAERVVNRESGEYTAKAQGIISRFAELTAASNTFAKTLQDVARESKAAADAEMKRNQKAAEQVAVLSSQEKTLDQVNRKIKLLTGIMQGLDKSDPVWKTLAGNLERVRQKQTELQAVQKAELAQLQGEYNAVKQLISSLQGYGSTIGQIQTKLAAFKSTLNNTTVGGAAFREAALQIKAMNEELQRANQLVQNYQSKSLQGVGKKNTDATVRQMEQLQERIRQIDAQMNLAHAKGQDMGTRQMISLLQERINLEEKLKNLMTTGADAAKQKLDAEIAAQQKLVEEAAKRAEAYNKKRQQEAEDLAAQQRKAAEEARIKQESIAKEQQANEARKRILSEQRLSYDTLVQKIQMLEAARNKTDIGAARWTRLTTEINKTRESLKTITDEMDKASRRSERLARLREIFSMSEKSMAGLSARLQEYNSRLQRLDVGTAAFDRTAQKVAALSLELQRATQYAQDFAQKAFQGLSAGDTSKRVAELQMWRQQLQQVEEEYNRLRNFQMQNGSNAAIDKQINALLEQRMNIVRNINQATLTAEQAQVSREKEINRIIESRNAKQKAHNDAVVKTVQARKQERAMLMANERTIDNVTKKLQYWQSKLNSTDMRSGNFTQIAGEVQRLTAKLEKLKQKMAEATGQTEQGADKQKTAVRSTTEEFKKQETYVSRLLKRLAVYASFSMVGNFLTKVREITAQFELQKISLGAILQDQAKANLLFSEIKSFALTSPVKILDLTKYTKQLAAYKIGYEDLFETTKRLTDVSVGLGVSMDRIILMYGQIRATGYLRASEVRQATEAGIPLVEELAKKLTKANGELVTAAQVMDMISKRQISFEQVKEVFEEMTDKGGIFYNMQEKQGNTLYGMWEKLGDAAAVMYDQIGNTEVVNSGMKMVITAITELMRHWKSWATLLGVTGALYLSSAGGMKLMRLATLQYTAAGQKLIGVQKAKVLAAQKEVIATKQAGVLAQWGARQDLAIAAAKLKATTATNIFTASLYKLWAAFLTNPLGWILTIVGAAIALFADFDNTLNELNGTLGEINEKYLFQYRNSADSFKRLADAAVSAADGSKAQREALDELNRTYGDILGSENLQIERLRALKGEYAGLAAEIAVYNARMKYQEREAAYKDYFGTKKKSAYSEFVDELSTIGFGEGEAGTEAGMIIASNVQEALLNELEKKGKATVKTAEALLVKQLTNLHVARGMSEDDAEYRARVVIMRLKNETQEYVDILNAESNTLKANDKARDKEIERLSQYQTILDKVLTSLKGITEQEHGVSPMQSGAISVKPSAFVKGFDLNSSQDLLNAQIVQLAVGVKLALVRAGVQWEDAFATLYGTAKSGATEIGSIEFPNILKQIIDSSIDEQTKGQLLNAVEGMQKAYLGIAPTDQTSRVIMGRVNDLSAKFGVNANKANQFIMKEGEGLSDYRKRLEDESEKIVDATAKLEIGLKWARMFGWNTEESEKKLQAYENERKFIEGLLDIIGRSSKSTSSRSGGDTRLQELQELFKALKSINKEYDDLAKKQGATEAADWIKTNYEATLIRLNKLAKKFKLNFDFPLTPENLQKYGKQIIDKINALKLKGGDKAVIDLQLELAKDTQSRLEKEIEARLKELSDRISRTKTAKEFYEKILEQTGNVDLAARVSLSVYGSTGEELFKDTVQQIQEAFKTGSGARPINLDISSAIDIKNQRIDYKKLADIYEKYQDEIIEKRRDTAKKIISEGQKEVAANILNWQKSLAKAKSYEQKRTDIVNAATAERAKIIREVSDPQTRGELLGLSYSKQAQDLTALAVDEFKSSDDYVKVFQDLDRVSTRTLDRMRTRLEEMIATVKKTENVEGLKSLVEQLDKIKEERETRNPIEGIIDSFKEYAAARKEYRAAEAAEATAKAEFAQQEADLNLAINTAKAEQAEAQRRVDELTAQGKENTDEGVAAELALNNATKKVAQAEQNRNEAANKVLKAEQNTTDALDAQKSALAKLQKNVNAMANAFSSAASSIKTIADLMGVAEDSELGDIVNGLVDGLNNAATIMTTILAIAIAIESACWWLLAIGAAVSVFSALGSWLTGSKVRKANKEIEKQQELLDGLEYTYGRLQAAADKLFGAEYINNYNQQISNLEAQQEAYLKQAEAERSKGKKADEEKIKEYEDAARDTADQIKELQDELVEHFTGSGLTDIARQMAQSWIEARASLSDTYAAIASDYQEMIKTMIVEGAAARVIENALAPMWESMEELLQSNNIDGAIEALINGMDSALDDANDGMEVLWQALEAKGYDMKKLLSDTDGSEYSGIAKSVSGATSEEINNVAAIGNTLMYYVSPIPRIDENLARILAIMQGEGASVVATSTSAGWTDWQQQAMDNYIAIQRNTADTVVECRRAAEACEKITSLIKVKGSIKGLNVFMN